MFLNHQLQLYIGHQNDVLMNYIVFIKNLQSNISINLTINVTFINDGYYNMFTNGWPKCKRKCLQNMIREMDPGCVLESPVMSWCSFGVTDRNVWCLIIITINNKEPITNIVVVLINKPQSFPVRSPFSIFQKPIRIDSTVSPKLQLCFTALLHTGHQHLV